MSLYRATSKLVNRIMTGCVPVRAFVAGLAIDSATPGSPGVTGHIAGLDLRDLIDPSTRSFSMPAALSPVSDPFRTRTLDRSPRSASKFRMRPALANSAATTPPCLEGRSS